MPVIDTLVGQRIKARRLSLRMTQTQLAEQIGVTFQQVQKYENGTNRVSAARLWAIARVCDVPIGFFFEDAASEGPVNPALSDGKALEILELYGRMTDSQKMAVLSFLRSIAEPADVLQETA